MTDTTAPAHTDPTGTPVPDVPEPAGTRTPPVPATEVQPRRRVRIAALRQAVVEAREHDAYRVLVRHGAYVLGGTRVLTRRAWEARTTAMHSRMIRQAEAAGNEELIRQWEQRAYAFRFARHKRRMDILQMLLNAPKAIASAVLSAGSVLLVLGLMLAWYNHDVSDLLTPLDTAVELVGWVAFVAGVLWEPVLYSLPWLALAGAWAVGRHRQTAPLWALPVGGDERDIVPDEGAILRALGNLGIAPLNKAIKDGWQPRWEQPTTRSGNGWHTQLQLPMGVTVEMICGRKNVLAHNLLRKPVEVWPIEPPKQPGVLDLWVADQGSLSGAVPPWPLLTEGVTDYFKGVPVAVSQRGDAIIGKLMAANYMVGGIMGSGKSSLVIALLLGAILDPLVIVEAYVMAYNTDYDPLKPRLRTLVKGDDDEDIEAALKALRSLRDEVTLRGKLLEELGEGATKVTRELALKDPRMRPKVVVFDECHELFMHKEYGKEAAELAIKVMKKARKVAITLVWVTVSPTADSLPRDVTRNTSHRVAFAVGDHVANDGLLGSGKHKAGITATTLIPGEDVGTAVTVGFSNKPFEVVRAHYVARDPDKGIDEVTPIVVRAMGLYEGGVPVDDEPMFQPADPLADTAAVLADETRILAQEVLHRLAARNPEAYGSWGPTDLKRALEPYGAEQYKSNGVMVVASERIQDAILERFAEDVADVDDEEGPS
ncbi:cell division protein FtsK [Streptomyces sp. NBC_00878]|uniref:cell division protein FtsK n=1 Tax=Streptomyces sp. NBC_00878 TaxID=2975854 RepID=UPI00225B468F|nr:cell division protein FtsK [Streptomyces sp. NBC_00878]MCX4906851.1 cell division protein FtsK [Streptomyces sp. NBC_00878]